MTVATAEAARHSRRLQGVVLMVLAMLTIPAVDGFAKALSAGHSPLFVGWARYAVACLVVLPIAFARHGGRMFPAEQRGSHLVRTVLLVVSMTLYFQAIARIPLATANGTFFVAPILAVVLSIVILKEEITRWKLISLALGFAGSLVILRPDASIDPGMLFALGAGVAFAFYLIVTRRAAQGSDPLKTLAFQCSLGALLLTPQALWFWSTPAWSDLAFFAGLGLFSAISHMMSIAAFRLADASTLAPLVYLELIGTSLIGYFGFGEIPGAATIVGAALIVLAGLILVRRRPEDAENQAESGVG
jgi:drug/metabolite transporter (DMT)-like permease